MKISKKYNNRISKKKTYKKKKYKGGNKLIGQGAFGCVISPAIKCSDCKSGEMCDIIDLNKNVSKILSTIEADKEYQTYESFDLDKIITDSDKYFIKPLIQCLPSNMDDSKNTNNTNNNINKTSIENKKQSHDEIQKCLSRLGDKRSMIVYNNGGLSLEQLLKKIRKQEIENLNPTSIIKGLKNVLEGLLKLGDNKIVHFDIKSENIVVGNDFENLDCKIIDFGVAKNFRETFNYNELDVLYENQYFIHPPYSIFFSGQYSFDTEFDMFSDIINDFFKFNYTKTYEHPYLKQLRKFYNESNNESNNESKNKKKIIESMSKDLINIVANIDNFVKIIIPDLSENICGKKLDYDKNYYELYAKFSDHIRRIIVKIFDIYSFGVLLLYCSDFFPEEFYNEIQKFLNKSKILSSNIYEVVKLRKDVLKMYDELITECEKIKWVK